MFLTLKDHLLSFFPSENMYNVYETFGEEETLVLIDLLREYLGTCDIILSL